MRMSVLLVMLALAGGVQAPRPGPQPLAPGSSGIHGTIVDAITKAPIPDVAVRLFDYRQMRTGSTLTNSGGQYEFAGIADGEYSLSADSNDHLFSCYQPTLSDPPRCANVSLVRDQVKAVDLQLIPGAIVRGRVVDAAGKPIAKASIRLDVFRSAAFGPMSSALSREDGSFELVRLPAGEWLLELEIPASPHAVRPPLMYYPGVVYREEAQTVRLAAGETVANIDFVVPDVARNSLTLHVSSPGGAVGDVSAAVIRAAPLMMARVELNDRGVGTLGGLLPGRYFAAARAWTDKQPLVAFDAIDFVEGPRDVMLQLQPAGSIAGRIVARPGGLPPLAGVRVAAAWVHDDVEVNPLVPDQVEAAPDGSFRIDGLFGQRSLQLIGLPADWAVLSVLRNRTDVTRAVTVPPDTTVNVTIVLSKR